MHSAPWSYFAVYSFVKWQLCTYTLSNDDCKIHKHVWSPVYHKDFRRVVWLRTEGLELRKHALHIMPPGITFYPPVWNPHDVWISALQTKAAVGVSTCPPHKPTAQPPLAVSPDHSSDHEVNQTLVEKREHCISADVPNVLYSQSFLSHRWWHISFNYITLIECKAQ
jgi:hypothetical protein